MVYSRNEELEASLQFNYPYFILIELNLNNGINHISYEK